MIQQNVHENDIFRHDYQGVVNCVFEILNLNLKSDYDSESHIKFCQKFNLANVANRKF